MLNRQEITGNCRNGCDHRIRSANLHINRACNYNCKFCFARNLVRKTMTPGKWEPRLVELRSMGIEKINFVGGEPTMHPQFLELCSMAKELGFTVSVVTNGSRIDGTMIEKMKRAVDWIGISVDSPSNEVEKELGRQCKGIDHIANAVKVAGMAHDTGIKVKLNITVVRQSWNSDFGDLIETIGPERVKAFQVLKVEGENEDAFDECSVTPEQWDSFVSAHESIVLKNGEKVIFEGGDAMVDSYLMMDPICRVMQNSGNKQSYKPFEEFLKGSENVIAAEKYEKRGAVYRWRE